MDAAEVKKNPSRKECEQAIRRILMTEVLSEGQNHHFKTAMDFMSYFESLYPASPSLIKQVQRAIKAMDLPKDEKGYFIIDKTKEQMQHDAELSHLLKKSYAEVMELDTYETVFLSAHADYRAYLLQLIRESKTLSGKYITILDTSDGLLFLTSAQQRRALETALQSLIDRK